MFIDAREIDDGTELDCDICIVGAGAAGITLARELDGGSLDVCVLESGGLQFDDETQDLADGESVGGRYKVSGVGPDEVVAFSRLRYFGGTTNHWEGWSRPLDEVDFEERPGVPGSGWPIDRADLAPYYERAQEICQLGPPDYAAGTWAERARVPALPGTDEVGTEVYQLSPPTRFGTAYRRALRSSRNVRVVLHANAVGLAASGRGTRVERVRVATLTGRRFEVRARRFVLAAGGIENARLLLVSNDARRRGLGNDKDLVGRYFADHPHGYIALVAIGRDLDLRLYRLRRVAGTRIRAALETTERFAEAHGLLRFSVTFERPFPLRRPPELSEGILELLRPALRDDEPTLDTALYMRTEMAPNRDSRVTLGVDQDALGLPRVRVDWRLGELDRRSVDKSLEAVARALGQHGIGRVLSVPALNPAIWDRVEGGNHHIGTTRMHDSPRSGVVDADCRVHGVSNLFVAGSSVFTTSGVANPTLTIVALALRLARSLRTARP